MDRSLPVGHYFRFFYRYSKLMVAIVDDDLRLRIGWSDNCATTKRCS